ncbi:MAG TPA: deaminase [Actinomycetota bacterium]|nr:deaminase [Actinomycetota bacterium]
MAINERTRADWDTYFLGLAAAAASRSSCTQDKHGAVMVSKRRIRSTGYNGTPTGYGHCDEGACPRGKKGDPTKPCWGLHAEANALLYTGPEEREGATLYVTCPPCIECAKLIANSGLREVVAQEGPSEDLEKVRRFLLDCKVRFRILGGDGTGQLKVRPKQR